MSQSLPDAPTEPMPAAGASPSDATTLVLGRYRLGPVLGHGGMATVYRGTDVHSGRPVAIKVLAPHLAGDPQLRRRLLAEARAVAQVSHPHVVQLVEVAAADPATGGTVLIMEYVPGESLAERLRRGPLPVPEAVELAAQVAEALAFAHARGVIHRDVKPHNILLTTPPAAQPAVPGWAKLADFGIARLGDGATTLTQAGTVLGSAPYLAPEILQGQPASPQSDGYALGVTLFEMLAGRTPFAAETVAASLSRRLIEPAPRVRTLRPDVPAWLDELVAQLLERHPAQRLAGCGRLVQLLRRGDGAATQPVGLLPPAAGAARRPQAPRHAAATQPVTLPPPAAAVASDATRVLVPPHPSRGEAAGRWTAGWAAWLGLRLERWRTAARRASRRPRAWLPFSAPRPPGQQSPGASGTGAQWITDSRRALSVRGRQPWRAMSERLRHATRGRGWGASLAVVLFALLLLAGALAARPSAPSAGITEEPATAVRPAATATAPATVAGSAPTVPSPTPTVAPTATRVPAVLVRVPAPQSGHPPKRHEPKGESKGKEDD